LPIVESEICKEAHYQPNENCAPYEVLIFFFVRVTQFLKTYEGAFTAASTIATAIFTWRLWVSTDKLWEESRNTSERQAGEMRKALLMAERSANASRRSATAAEHTVDVMRDTAERQLRAYVSAVSAEIKHVEIGGSPEATVVVRNSGQTPAHRLNRMGGIGIGISFDVLAPGVGPAAKTVASLAAGGSNLQFHKANWTLTQDHMTALQNGDLTIWVYGEMNYRDVFNRDWFTKFRFQTGGAMGIQGNRLAASEDGNEET
jgi:hypothetical protein